VATNISGEIYCLYFQGRIERSWEVSCYVGNFGGKRIAEDRRVAAQCQGWGSGDGVPGRSVGNVAHFYHEDGDNIFLRNVDNHYQATLYHISGPTVPTGRPGASFQLPYSWPWVATPGHNDMISPTSLIYLAIFPVRLIFNLTTEAANFSEMSMKTYLTTRCRNPVDHIIYSGMQFQ
jgi:hypothetical protein